MSLAFGRALRAAHWLLRPRSEMPDRDQVRRILIAAQMGIGNMVMFTPLLRALRAGFPEAHIALVLWKRNGAENVVAGSPWVDEVIQLDTEGESLLRRVLKGVSLGRRGWDLAIARFNGMPEEILAAFVFGRVPIRAAHATGADWRSGNDHLLNVPVSMEPGSHEVDRYLAIAHALGLPPPERKPVFFLSQHHRGRAAELLREIGIGPGDSFVAIQPGTSRIQAWKRWPTHHWRSLIDAIHRMGYRTVAFGSADERSFLQDICTGTVAVNAAGLFSLRETGAGLERAAALVCTDSSLMHIAAAVGTRLVALFGPTDERRTGPVGGRSVILRTGCSARPCLDLAQLRPGCRGSACMEEIDPALVAYELEKLLQTPESSWTPSASRHRM